jgi:S-adenosylmethionine:tRNA ribosyltransferase-isomerase
LPQDSVFIFNDTKVIKARLFGTKATGGKVEALFCKELSDGLCEVLIRGRVKKSDEIFFADHFKAVVQELHEDGARSVEFYHQNTKIVDINELYDLFDKHGHVPLPPYIHREDDLQDSLTYQSAFAKNSGSVAAPTASLHFDDELLSEIKKSFKHAFVTLHIGLGTFKPVESANIAEHKIHTESYFVSNEAQSFIDSQAKILAVGTTSARTIEHYHATMINSGECNIFLHPKSPPKRIDMLMTNFHLPKSTLIMLVSSMVGLEKTLEIYKEAVRNNYRFYSYGDAMLIL